jgi:CO/xanthine dehydrogenase Mo-binding subunit
MTEIRTSVGQVGSSIPRLESRAKVTGQADYTHNLRLLGMLHAKICRSSVAHGKLRSVDTSAAEEMPGVHAVVTGQDILKIIEDPHFGPAFHDQPIMAIDKVRYVGEPIAAVLASDPQVAEEAAAMIYAEIEELPAVFDEIEAMDSNIYVHDVLKPAGTFADLKHLDGRRDTNVALDYNLRVGDPDKAFADAPHVFEHEFRTQQAMHTPFEPMVSVAEVSGTTLDDSRLVLHSSTQTPSFVRAEIARLLKWPENRVRVLTRQLGGGFGAKVYVKMEAMAAALALIVRFPVRVALTMEEQFYTITKHPTTFRIKSAVSHDGTLLARKCQVYWNSGAYADIGPRVTQKSGFTAPGPYHIENIDVFSASIYTNRPPSGALRGFGIPQLVWAYESHTDIIARELGIDTIAFRRKNLLREDQAHATGTPMADAPTMKVMDRVAELMNWDQEFDRGSDELRRGRGVAIGFKACISPTTSGAMVNISADGSITLYCSTVDMGQGSDTAMAQIVAEVLQIDAEMINVVHADTDVTPYDMGTLGSRSTYHMGNAVRLAAEDARDKLKALADGASPNSGDNLSIPEIFRNAFGMKAGNIIGVGQYYPKYKSPDPKTGRSEAITPFWMIGAAGVEVTIDTETGRLFVDRLINVVDAGTPLNPKIVETQISGAAIMQLGFTMTEEMRLDGGQVTNASLAEYKIPGFGDIPRNMVNVMVDNEQQSGPFGAKGVGESATFGVSPAIANAIDDALGVRLTTLPLTPEAIHQALRAATGADQEKA